MRFEKLKAQLTAVIVALACGSMAYGAGSDVVIGNLDDLSGVYSDDGGPGSVEAMNMASTRYILSSRTDIHIST